MRLLLDTHVWLWLALRDSRLGQDRRRAIDRAAAAGDLFVSPINVWEIAMLERKRRVRLDQPIERWMAQALSAPGLGLAPFSPEIAIASCRLPDPFHGDPADRILVATAIDLGARLVTDDRKIIAAAKGMSLPVLT